MKHQAQLEVRATCTCGWRSINVRAGTTADRDALVEWASHARVCHPRVPK